MAWDFRPGMKVVCVDAADTSADGEQELVEGRIYTIRDVALSGLTGMPLHLCVWLEEIRDRFDENWPQHGDVPFAARRFRPLVERKTSIEIFKAMLTPQRHSEDA